jgi:hypothetical protein
MAEKAPDEAIVKKAKEAMKKMVDEMEKAGKTYKTWSPIFGHGVVKVSVREWNHSKITFRGDGNSTMNVHAKAVDVKGEDQYNTVTPGHYFHFYAGGGTVWDFFEITGLGAGDDFAFGSLNPLT